jgi:hypothetical protein
MLKEGKIKKEKDKLSKETEQAIFIKKTTLKRCRQFT